MDFFCSCLPSAVKVKNHGMVKHSASSPSLSLKDWSFQKIFKVTSKDNKIVNKYLNKLKETISPFDKKKVLKSSKHTADSFFTMLQEDKISRKVILSKQT